MRSQGQTGMKKLAFIVLSIVVNVWSLNAGFITRLIYTDVPGGSVDDLRMSAKFPDQPSGEEILSDYFGSSIGNPGFNNYGSLIRGYIEAPQTGNYTFWVSGDDTCELWLSTNTSPASKVLIARVPQATLPGEWNKYEQQRSSPIYLERGKYYYVEVLHKEDNGLDHVEVGWQLPDGTLELPIKAIHLFPYGQYEEKRIVKDLESSISVDEGQELTLFVNLESTTIPKFQWFKNGKPIEGATLSFLTIEHISAMDNGSVFYVKIDDQLESSRATVEVITDTQTPEVLAVDTMGYDNLLKVTFSEQVLPSEATNIDNYAFSPISVISNIILWPDKKSVLITAGRREEGKPYKIKIQGVKDYSQTGNPMPPTELEFIQSQNAITANLFYNIPTFSIDGMTNISKFPANPDCVTYLNSFAFETNTLSSFGALVCGYLFVPITGNYVFGIASDGQSILYLSSDDKSWNKKKICSVSNGTAPADYLAEESQISAPIKLQSGKKYYIEAIYLSRDINSHLSVTWQIPGSTNITSGNKAIPGQYLSTFDRLTGPLSIVDNLSDIKIEEGETVVFSAKTDGWPSYTWAQWFENDKPLFGQNSLELRLDPVGLTNNGSKYYLMVSNLVYAAKSKTVTLYVTEDKTPPKILSVYGEPTLDRVKVRFSDKLDYSSATNIYNYIIDGGVAVISVSLDSTKSNLTIYTTPQQTNQLYNIYFYGIKDKAGNEIDSGFQMEFATASFMKGFVVREVYKDAGIVDINSFTNNLKYSQHIPDKVELLSLLEAPTNSFSGVSFGQRIYGFVIPPVSGNYIFYLSSSGRGQLWLSSDDSYTNIGLTPIVEEPDWNCNRNWEGETAQNPIIKPGTSSPFLQRKSKEIFLDAGRMYYFEAIAVSTNGNDCLSVAWKLPNGSEPKNFDLPIVSTNLGAFVSKQVIDLYEQKPRVIIDKNQYGKVVLRWEKVTDTGFVLYFTSNLDSGIWTPSSDQKYDDGDFWKVIIEPSGNSRFFRLVK